MKRKWGFLPVILVAVLLFSEFYLSFIRIEEPRIVPEVVIKAAPAK